MLHKLCVTLLALLLLLSESLRKLIFSLFDFLALLLKVFLRTLHLFDKRIELLISLSEFLFHLLLLLLHLLKEFVYLLLLRVEQLLGASRKNESREILSILTLRELLKVLLRVVL